MKSRFFKQILVLLIVHFCYNVKAQTDTAFWFSAPDINQNHNELPIELKLIGLSQNASVKIYQPANFSFSPINVSLPAGAVSRVDLSSLINSIETRIPNGVNKTGLKIESSTPIQAYYEVVGQNRNTDIFTLKGRNALDTLFYVPGNNLLPNWTIQPGQTYYNGVLIQADQNNTVITIRSPVAVNGKPAGTSFQVTLQKGEVYFLRSVDGSKGAKLAGTRVASNKPIAITFYDDSAYPRGWNSSVGTCADLCGDQAVGVSNLGTIHVAIRGPGLTSPLNDIVFITATKDSTALTINGSFVKWMKESETHAHMMGSSEQITLVETNKNVVVAQISGFGCEVGMALIPNLECTGSQTVSFTRSDATTGTSFAMNLLVPAGHEKSFRINGSLISAARRAQFSVIPGTSNRWKYATINLSADFGANANVRVSNDSVVFHCGVINGQAVGSGCRFGYFSDFSRYRPRLNFSSSTIACAGSSFRLTYNAPERPGTEWILPDGRKISAASLFIPKIALGDSGLFIGTYNNNSCAINARDSIRVRTDSIHVAFQLKPAYCSTDSIWVKSSLYSASGIASSFWTYNGIPATGSVFRTGPQSAGLKVISLQGSSRLGCIHKHTDTIKVFAQTSAKFTPPGSLCYGDTLRLKHTGGFQPGSEISWKWYINGSLVKTDSLVQFSLKDTGRLTVSLLVGNKGGCTDSQAFNGFVYALPSANLTVKNSCQGDSVVLSAAINWHGLIPRTTRWDHGDGSSVMNNVSRLVYNSAGVFKVVFTAESQQGCKDTFNEKIVIWPQPLAQWSENGLRCVGSSLQLVFNGSWNGPRGSLSWNNNNVLIGRDSLILINPSKAENLNILLRTENAYGCFDSSVKIISIYDRPFLTTSADTICLGMKNTLKASINWGKGAGGNWNWKTGDGSIYTDSLVRHTYKNPGTFKAVFTSTNSAGCNDSDMVYVRVYPRPEAAFTADPNPVVAGSDVLLSNRSKGAFNWEWMLDNKLFSSDKEPVIKSPLGGKYKLELIAISSDNCRDSTEIILLVTEKASIYIPNSFTPDDNGHNEIFRVYGLEKTADKYFLRIYSRWGEKLFETTNPKQGWDGRYGPDAKLCQEGQYVFLMHCVDIFGNSYNRKGTVLLLR